MYIINNLKLRTKSCGTPLDIFPISLKNPNFYCKCSSYEPVLYENPEAWIIQLGQQLLMIRYIERLSKVKKQKKHLSLFTIIQSLKKCKTTSTYYSKFCTPARRNLILFECNTLFPSIKSITLALLIFQGF